MCIAKPNYVHSLFYFKSVIWKTNVKTCWRTAAYAHLLWLQANDDPSCPELRIIRLFSQFSLRQNKQLHRNVLLGPNQWKEWPPRDKNTVNLSTDADLVRNLLHNRYFETGTRTSNTSRLSKQSGQIKCQLGLSKQAINLTNQAKI